MSKLIPPPPPRAPIGYIGTQPVHIANDWALYLTVGLLQRVGGYNAPTINELQDQIDDLDARVDALEGAIRAWVELEIDFGAAPVTSAQFQIVDANITPSSLMRVMPVAKASSGRTADDWAWDTAVFTAQPDDGQATVYATFIPGPIVGPRKIQYSVG